MSPHEPYQSAPKMRINDLGVLFALIFVVAVITFTNLGYNFAPQTAWGPAAGETALVDFGDIVTVSAFQFYMGHDNQRSFMIAASQDGRSWRTLYNSQSDYPVFKWNRINFESYTQARFIEIIPFGTAGIKIMEAGFRDESGAILPIYSILPYAEALFDEQHLIPESSCFMSGTYFDEVHYVRTGYEFIHGLPPGEITHPPLGKVFQSISIAIFGMTPFAWRLPGALFGLAMIPLIYAFARQLFKSNNWALFAAFIFSVDFMRFVQTRIATIDSYVTFFIIAMYFLMYIYIRSAKHKPLAHSVGLLVLCGVSMGMAIATKWQGIYAAAGLPLLFFPTWLRIYKENKKQAIITAAVCTGAFIVLPLLIYVLSYIPFANSMGANSISDTARIIWENQRFMLGFHGGLEDGHIYGSPWWSWPLMLTPFHYYAGVSGGLRTGIVALGNPAIWWFGILATAVALYKLIKQKQRDNHALIFLLVGYAMQFLPWVFVTRVVFIYHYFPSVPFVVLIITWLFKTQIRKPAWALVYAALAAGLFIMFYPVLSGAPIEWDYVSNRLWWTRGVIWR